VCCFSTVRSSASYTYRTAQNYYYNCDRKPEFREDDIFQRDITRGQTNTTNVPTSQVTQNLQMTNNVTIILLKYGLFCMLRPRMEHVKILSSSSSSSSALQPWVGLGLGLLKQMSPAPSTLGIRPPMSTNQFPCIFLSILISVGHFLHDFHVRLQYIFRPFVVIHSHYMARPSQSTVFYYIYYIDIILTKHKFLRYSY